MSERVRILNEYGAWVEADKPSERKGKMRRFVLDRIEDPTGMSGTGVVAEGVRFTDGTAVLRWITTLTSTAIYDTVDELIHIHGHGGTTQIVWIDQ